MQQNWFESWFNSTYYHILYSGRNTEEAEFLIDNLIQWLQPAPTAKILDIACGKGRHSVYLHSKGFEVIGIDLAENSIVYAQQFEDERLHFFVHDMRKLFYIHYFDISLNLFTSFGYFNSDRDNVKALKAFAKGLKAGGTLVIDYLNVVKVIAELKQVETKIVQNIEFNIKRKISEGKIIKEIQFSDEGRDYAYSEKVQAISLSDFDSLLDQAGLTITHAFGNYKLDEFDAATSDRLLLICKKK